MSTVDKTERCLGLRPAKLCTTRVLQRLGESVPIILVLRDKMPKVDNDGFVELHGSAGRLSVVRCGR